MLTLQGERVPVRNEDLASIELLLVLLGHKIKVVVRVPRVIWTQHLKALSYRQIRRTNKHTVRKLRARWVSSTIQEGPCDEHGHHSCLPRAGSHFAAETAEGNLLGVPGRIDETWPVGVCLGSEWRTTTGKQRLQQSWIYFKRFVLCRRKPARDT